MYEDIPKLEDLMRQYDECRAALIKVAAVDPPNSAGRRNTYREELIAALHRIKKSVGRYTVFQINVTGKFTPIINTGDRAKHESGNPEFDPANVVFWESHKTRILSPGDYLRSLFNIGFPAALRLSIKAWKSTGVPLFKPLYQPTMWKTRAVSWIRGLDRFGPPEIRLLHSPVTIRCSQFINCILDQLVKYPFDDVVKFVRGVYGELYDDDITYRMIDFKRRLMMARVKAARTVVESLKPGDRGFVLEQLGTLERIIIMSEDEEHADESREKVDVEGREKMDVDENSEPLK
jgi:hypothetical protein